MKMFSLSLCVLALIACGEKPGTDGEETGFTVVDADKDGFDSTVDCDDSDADVNPDAEEVCDGIDNNCDDEIDEDTATDAGTWYADSDSDSYGDANISIVGCEMPEGYVEDGSDCDDTSELVNPGAAEVCDGIDNDCDASTSEDGTVVHTATDGVQTDVTSSLTGTASSPAVYTFTEGSLTFCDGVHYVNLLVSGDGTVGSQSQDPTRTSLNGAGLGTVVSVDEPGSTVLVSDLTIENGFAITELGSAGGGVSCASFDSQTGGLDEAIDLQLENLIVSNNVADEYGAGVFAVGCDLTLLNSEISYNTSEYYAGGLWLSDGDSSLTGVEIFENTAPIGGGVLIWGSQFGSGNHAGTLDDVVVTGNTGAATVGGIALLSGSFSWVGTSGSQGSGAWNNQVETETASGLSLDSVAFQAQGVDFGTSADGTDNLNYDIEMLSTGVGYNADDDAFFSCDEDGCGTSTVTVNGGTANDSLYYGLLGTIFTVDDIGTLDSFEPWTATNQSSCPVDFYLLSASTSHASSWTVEWAAKNQVSSTTLDFKNSTQVGFPLDPSLFYAVAWHHSACGNRYAWTDEAGVGETITGLGTTVGYMYNSQSTATYSVGDAVPNMGTFTTLTWRINFNVTKL